MTEETYTPLPPEEDKNLQSNPHYWLYKVTRDALDNQNHPLHDMGHIWNRWACEGLSEAEVNNLDINTLEIKIDRELRFATDEEEVKNLDVNLTEYSVLLDDEKEKVTDYINKEYKVINWQFSDLNSIINFSSATFNERIDFSEFIFIQYASFSNSDFMQFAAFCKTNFIQGVDFMDTKFKDDANFVNIRINKYTCFRRAVFEKKALFLGAIFAHIVLFIDADFIQGADFIKVIFAKSVSLQNVKFRDNTNFSDTIFTKNADFKNAIFFKNADFNNSTFTKDANFISAKFLQTVIFTRVKFEGYAYFSNAKFEIAYFIMTEFKDNAFFLATRFKQYITFSGTLFLGDSIGFQYAKFLETPHKNNLFSFDNTIFATKVNFSESEFHHLPNLTGIDFRGGINLDKVKFPPDFSKTPKSSFPTAEAKPQGKGNLKIFDKIRFPFFFGASTSSANEKTGMTSSDDCPIKGGLSSYTDAAVTWHALSTEMEKAGYHDQALLYFGYELEAKRLNPETGRFFRFILGAYKNISDYGHSIFDPFRYWILCAIIFLFIYCGCFAIASFFSETPCNFLATEFLCSIKFALKGLLPFVSDQTTFFDRMFDDDEKNKIIPAKNILEIFVFPLLYGLHTLLSLVLIFLFGLGVRNRLRLR